MPNRCIIIYLCDCVYIPFIFNRNIYTAYIILFRIWFYINLISSYLTWFHPYFFSNSKSKPNIIAIYLQLLHWPIIQEYNSRWSKISTSNLFNKTETCTRTCDGAKQLWYLLFNSVNPRQFLKHPHSDDGFNHLSRQHSVLIQHIYSTYIWLTLFVFLFSDFTTKTSYAPACCFRLR